MVRFSVRSSSARCTSRELVVEEKAMASQALAAGSREPRKAADVTVLLVPGSPTSRQGRPDATTVDSSHCILGMWRGGPGGGG